MDKLFSDAFELIDNALATWEQVRDQVINPYTAELSEEMVERGMQILKKMGVL